jgi:chromosome segregation ATPase
LAQASSSGNLKLKAQLAAMKDSAAAKGNRLADLEASQAELRAQLRSLQIRFEKTKKELDKNLGENERLKVFLQEADNAALQLELEVGKATQNEKTVDEQEETIQLLAKEVKELKGQVLHLTKQLELAVEDLEVEAAQTERFTNCFMDLSERIGDRETDDNDQIRASGFTFA